jgi:hypothetical protein
MRPNGRGSVAGGESSGMGVWCVEAQSSRKRSRVGRGRCIVDSSLAHFFFWRFGWVEPVHGEQWLASGR